jgi:hypothetical protein
MKFVCLGYFDAKKFDALSETERNTLFDECFAYDDVLRAHNHYTAGEGLESHTTAKTLRWKNGKVAVTDGPYAETREQIGGFLVLEARDLNQAIELMSKHPGVKFSTFEIRPVGDMSELKRDSEQRRANQKAVSR